MQAKIDNLKLDINGEEYILYPKSLTRAIKDDNGNRLDNILADIQSQLGHDIDAHFVTETGFGDLRFYNGKFQYYDETLETWVDTTVGPENAYIVNMIPNAMNYIKAIYDIKLGYNKLKWEEPNDTIYDGQAFCIVDKVIIRRKLGSVPENEEDGDLLMEIPRRLFGQYKDTYYIDYDATPVEGDIYYYKAFPQSTLGFYNTATINETSAGYREYDLFGFRIDQTESDPDSMITYIEDNENYQSAYMDYSSDTFNYGDWKDAWFMNVRPCMLNYDGTVAYYLDPNDYTLKEDGTASDISNANFAGNAMVEIPKVYYKCVNISDDVAEYYFCNKKVDDDYHCWSHIDNNGNEIDYCYMPCYNGANIDGVLRSISGQATYSLSISNGFLYAQNNNKTDDAIWSSETFSDKQLIRLLILLISKSTDSQTVFGKGYTPGSRVTITAGTMNTKGLFWGSDTGSYGVKIFGMENWWGNAYRGTCGWVNDNGKQKIKLTYGQSDGSTVDGYNTTGEGYIELEDCTASGTSGGYINKMKFTEYGLISIASGGSASTYYCDGLYYNNSSFSFAMTGGDAYTPASCGILMTHIATAITATGWDLNTALSCKPLASTI